MTGTVLTVVLLISIPLMAQAADSRSRAQESGGSATQADSKLSPALAQTLSNNQLQTEDEVRVILQSTASPDEMAQSISSRGGKLKKALPLIGGYVATLPRRELESIAAEVNTQYVSLDREVSLLSDRYDYNLLRVTTGAENVVGADGLGGNGGDPIVRDYLNSLADGPNGRGVSIAVLDSGIYDEDQLHEDLRTMDDPAKTRVVTHQDFVASESHGNTANGYDPYGHGSHVAGVAAGSGLESLQAGPAVGNMYAGLAFNANLLDLRVIGADGTGYISYTIEAINWMIRNRDRYNIRVANFSIGAAVTQSYKKDPLCQAVERAVEAGIVCVVAAGNYGKDDQGQTIYGGILSPANDPFAITVGATNTWGSAMRSDDTIASYSSRGPTLVDGMAKPDLVAPGTLIRSIAANGNHLTAANNLTVYSQDGEDVYMWLSGTSVAAPVVSGAVALMLNANPSLTPAAVKSILQFSAQPLPSLVGTDPFVAMLTQGAGYLNVDGAVRLSRAFDRSTNDRPSESSVLRKDSGQLDSLLYATQGPGGEMTSAIAGETVSWGNNVFFSHGFVYSYDNRGRLIVRRTSGWQASEDFILLRGYVLTGGRVISDGRLASDGRMLTDGRVLTDGRILTDGRVLTDGWLWIDETNEFRNSSSAEPAYSTNLIDQGAFTSGLVIDQHSAENVMAWGDDSLGFTITRIESRKHPLYPRGRRQRHS
jgi:serine protease AprX